MRTDTKNARFPWAAVACLALVAAAVMLPRWGAMSAKTTLIVDTAGRKIPGLFDGMPSDPRYDLALLSLSRHAHPQERQKGLLHWLLERVDTVVYAQSDSATDPCGLNCGGCQGSYYISQPDKACNAGCTPDGPEYSQVMWDPSRGSETDGWSQSCSNSCECTAPDGTRVYDNSCASSICTRPAACSNDDQCPSNKFCNEGLCVRPIGCLREGNFCHNSGTSCTDADALASKLALGPFSRC